MPRTLTADLHRRVGQRVTLEGWVHRRRRLSRVGFVVVRDRSGLAQVVVPGGHERLDALGEQTVVAVEGTVVADPKAPGGAELTDPEFTVLGSAAPPPVPPWHPILDAGLPTLLDHAPVAWRPPRPGPRWGGSRPRRCAGSAARWTSGGSPRSRHRSWWAAPPSRARTSSRSTTSAGPRTSRSRRSSTSRSWSGCSSGSTRSAR